MIKSGICKQVDIESADFFKWSRNWETDKNEIRYHRKSWEWSFICQALYERGMLVEGKSGLVCAVGKESLPSIFASMGCEILATDISGETEAGKLWENGKAHSNELKDLFYSNICSEEAFVKKVSFQPMDMNSLIDFGKKFDFVWSSCSLEHIGPKQKGIDFIFNSLNYLKEGGVAIHTTEFLIEEKEKSIEYPGSVLYSQKDIQEVVDRINKMDGFHCEIDFTRGNLPKDSVIDRAPYSKDGHLNLYIGDHSCTSIGLIIEKAR